MFLKILKKTGFIFCCITAISACSIFESDKQLPTGTRVSIIDSSNKYNGSVNNTLAVLPSMTYTNDWLQIGGNSKHVMNNLSANDNMQKIWKVNFGKGENKRNLLLAQPIIVGDYIYTQDVHGTVSAFDIKNGNKIWKKKIKPSNKNILDNGLNGSGIASDGEKIFALTGFGSVIAFNALNGQEIWRVEKNTPLRTSPNICKNKLIIQTLDNRLLILNTQDGSEIFTYNTSSEDTVLAGGATPACSVEKNIIVAGFSNGYIETFNADIGYPLWTVSLVNTKRGNSTTNINAIKASPIIDESIIYAIGNNDMLTAFDYKSGEIIWSKDIGSTNTPWISGNYIYIVSNNYEIICLDKLSGDIIYSSKLLEEYTLEERADIYLSGPIMINNRLLVSASNGVIYIISATNGKVEHTIDIKSKIPFTPISASETVIFTTSDADIIAYR